MEFTRLAIADIEARDVRYPQLVRIIIAWVIALILLHIHRPIQWQIAWQLDIAKAIITLDNAAGGLRQIEVLKLPRTIVAPDASGNKREGMIRERSYRNLKPFLRWCPAGNRRPADISRPQVIRRRHLLPHPSRRPAGDAHLEIDVVGDEEFHRAEPGAVRFFAANVAAGRKLE